jgi:hypothetical protein
VPAARGDENEPGCGGPGPSLDGSTEVHAAPCATHLPCYHGDVQNFHCVEVFARLVPGT